MKNSLLLSIAGKILALITTILLLTPVYVWAKKTDKMKKKILFVVTSHSRISNTGEKTGFNLSEVAHPWEVLSQAGYTIDFVSPQGGKAPIDGINLGDSTNRNFWNNESIKNQLAQTLTPQEVKPDDYVAIYFAGGHGAMWDLANNTTLSSITAQVYEQGGIVSAVCHGVAGLVNSKLSTGKYLVNGKRINAFTNEEETAVKLSKTVPFLLESRLMERGAIFEKSGLWQPHVVTDQRVVTGQNPQSAKAVGEAVLEALQQQETMVKLTRFEIKESIRGQFRKQLTEYVQHSLSLESNVMSEAYYEQSKPDIVWLTERWINHTELTKNDSSLQAKALLSLAQTGLASPITYFYLKDLEPLSKQQWRKASKAADNQLTIMLFVDAKEGTEQTFKDIYHIAMPQFRSEPGVVTYQLSQLVGDSTQFVTYEKFRSNEAFQYHLNFPPIQPVIDYLNTSIKKQPFQQGLHQLVELAPLIRE